MKYKDADRLMAEAFGGNPLTWGQMRYRNTASPSGRLARAALEALTEGEAVRIGPLTVTVTPEQREAPDLR